MILQGQLLLPDSALRARLAPGQVLVQGDRITRIALGPGRTLGTADLGGDNALITPGFIDTHLHLPQFECIGVDGLTLLDWLDKAVFPAEARWADADYAGHATARVAKRLLAAGTTGIAAYATVHHGGAQAAIESLRESGVRAIVGQVLMDQQAPAELVRPARQLLAESASLQPVGRVEVAVTPRFAVSCSDELLRGAGELAQRTGWAVQTHLAETIPECEVVSGLHGGVAYTEVYRRAGLLTGRTILGHGIYLSDHEKACIRTAGSVIAHCPTANLFLQAGRMNRAGHVASGLRLSLGSDVSGGPDPCMVRVARGMIETAKSRRLGGPNMPSQPLPTPAEAWAQITWKNADAVGWGDGGRIAEGSPADVVVIDPGRGPAAEPGWLRAIDPLSLLLYAFDERWIAATIVAGRVAYTGV